MIWKLFDEQADDNEDNSKKNAGLPFKSLTGHNHFIADV